MKTNKFIMLAAITCGAAFVSCSNEDIPVPNPDDGKIVIGFENATEKSSLVSRTPHSMQMVSGLVTLKVLHSTTGVQRVTLANTKRQVLYFLSTSPLHGAAGQVLLFQAAHRQAMLV